MRKPVAYRLPLLLAILSLGSFGSLASRVAAQTALVPGISTPGFPGDGASDDLESLRRDLLETQRLLQVQQTQLDQQTSRLAELERELAETDPPGAPRAAQPPAAGPASQDAPLAGFPEDRSPGTSGAPCPQCPPGTVYPPASGDGGPARVAIGGQYRVMFNASNFDFHPEFLTDSPKSQTFFNQRFRTWLTVNPNENVEGYLQVQMGHNLWGDHFEFVKADVAPFFPAGDRVGIALRRGYLSYQNEGLGRLRAGVQDWQDSFGQTLASSDWDFNVGGLSWARTSPALGDMKMLMGMFALSEGDVKLADDAILFTWDLDWPLAEERNLGFSVYYLPDNGGYSYPTAPPYASAWDLWLGVRGMTKFWTVPVNAFALYNPGERRELGGQPTFSHQGWALKLEAGPVPLRYGKWSFQTLYSTGDDDPSDNHSSEFRTIAQSVRDNFGAQGYWSYLVITSPHGPSDVNDLGVSLQNRGLGLFTVQAKYEYPILARLSGTVAAGWLRSAVTNPTSDASNMGTELANIFTFDFGGGLKADFGASILFTGDFYKLAPAAPSPDDLWEAFTRVQLEF